MSYAIIQTGGKQVRVEPGRFYDIELLPVEPEGNVTIESVLLIQNAGEVTIGQPFVPGATVEGTVMRHFRDRKVLVYKMKPKKKTRKKRGHRQEITRLMINSISMNGSPVDSSAARQDETPVTNQTAASPINAEERVETPTEENAAPPIITEERVETPTEETVAPPITAEERVETPTEETVAPPITAEERVETPTEETLETASE